MYLVYRFTHYYDVYLVHFEVSKIEEVLCTISNKNVLKLVLIETRSRTAWCRGEFIGIKPYLHSKKI
jgi:hypothetical protein